MKYLITLLAILAFSIQAEESWVPEMKFELETRNHIETLIWVSGISYALSALQEQNQSIFCGAPESISSKQLLGYLNNAHDQKRITAEQAIETIFSKLNAASPCR